MTRQWRTLDCLCDVQSGFGFYIGKKLEFDNYTLHCEVNYIVYVDILIIQIIGNLPYCSRIPGMRNKAAERSNTINAVDVWPLEFDAVLLPPIIPIAAWAAGWDDEMPPRFTIIWCNLRSCPTYKYMHQRFDFLDNE